MATMKPEKVPKIYRKNKKFKLYKAYKAEDNDILDLKVDGDIYYLDSFHATERLINDLNIESSAELMGETITFVIVNIPTDSIDFDTVFLNSDKYSITLATADYSDVIIKCDDYTVKELEYSIDASTGLRKIEALKLDEGKTVKDDEPSSDTDDDIDNDDDDTDEDDEE